MDLTKNLPNPPTWLISEMLSLLLMHVYLFLRLNISHLQLMGLLLSDQICFAKPTDIPRKMLHPHI